MATRLKLNCYSQSETGELIFWSYIMSNTLLRDKLINNLNAAP